MNKNLHNELRKEFQLERLILFSDAVFAIAITLLVIEIKIPQIAEHDLTDAKLLNALGELTPKFIGFVISFLLIAQYWMVHHRMFGYVVNFTGRLVWLNILYLLAIALMPFSTGFYSEYAGRPVLSPMIFYTCNIALISIVNIAMWQYISNSKHNLTENLSPALAKYASMRAATVPVIFIICSMVYSISPTIAAFIPITIPFVLNFVFRPMKKRLFK